MATETCEPPPEHRGHRWHWLRNQDGEVEAAYLVRPQAWMTVGSTQVFSARYMSDRGWRYVGPAIPPAVEEGG